MYYAEVLSLVNCPTLSSICSSCPETRVSTSGTSQVIGTSNLFTCTCGAGTYSNNGNCLICTSGYYCPAGTTVPLACPANNYCPTGATSGTACPAGLVSNAGSSNISQCRDPLVCLSNAYLTSALSTTTPTSSSQLSCMDDTMCNMYNLRISDPGGLLGSPNSIVNLASPLTAWQGKGYATWNYGGNEGWQTPDTPWGYRSPVIQFQIHNLDPSFIQSNVTVIPKQAYALRFVAAKRPNSDTVISPGFIISYSNDNVVWTEIFNNIGMDYSYHGFSSQFFNQFYTSLFYPTSSNIFVRFIAQQYPSISSNTVWFARATVITTTPSCQCNKNYAMDSNGNCNFLCPNNSYCSGSTITSCPTMSISPAGSTSLSQCSCLLNTTMFGQKCACPVGNYGVTPYYYKFETESDTSIFNPNWNITTWVTDPSICKIGSCALVSPVQVTIKDFIPRHDLYPATFSTGVFPDPTAFTMAFWYKYPSSSVRHYNSEFWSLLTFLGSGYVNGATNMMNMYTSRNNWQIKNGLDAYYFIQFNAQLNTQWNHMAFSSSYDGTQLVTRVYLNGVAQTTAYTTFTKGPIQIKYFGLYMYYDELMFLPGSSTDAEITKIYQNSMTYCRSCPANSYCIEGVRYQCATGATSPAGSTTSSACVCSVSGSTVVNGSCVCPAGTYTNVSCVQCPADTYCPLNSTSAIACPAGKISPASSTELSQCKTAYVSVNVVIEGVSTNLNQSQFQGALPSNVAVDTYQDDLAVTPGDCPRGSYCPANTVAPVPCPAGTYNNKTNMVSLDACLGCWGGEYCPEASAVPTACPAGTYSPNGGATNPSVCINCTAGYYCPERSIAPQACLPGTYRATPGGTSVGSCLPCPPGQFCEYATATPQNCYAGTYRIAPGAKGNLECGDCPVGNYCPAGSVNPTNCPAGTYMDVSKSPGPCYDCLLAKYCPLASVNPTTCPQGTHRNITGGANVSDCFVCPAGTICTRFNGNTDPDKCVAGSYNPTAGATACLDCPGGTYCPTSGTAIPTNCTPGTYSSLTGSPLSAFCVPCLTGNYCPSGSVDPTNCSAGTYNSLTGQGSVASCLSCPVGQFCLLATTTPRDCAAGSYRGTPGAESQQQCATCPSGNYCPVKSVNPTNCTAGTYNMFPNKTIKADCLACPQGNACPIATSIPQACAVDTFSPASADVCSACPAFSSSPAQSPNCTCRGGHTQAVGGGGGGAPAAVSYTVVGTDDYLNQGISDYGLVPGNLNFLTINGYANLTVLKGTVVTLTMAPFNSVQSNLKLFFNTGFNRISGNMFYFELSDPRYSSTQVRDFVNVFGNPLTNANIAPSLFTTGVTGSGTSTLVFDTSQATPGNYYLGSDGVVSRRMLIIQVQSPTPATVSLPRSNGLSSFFATFGDSLIVTQYNGGTTTMTIRCVPNTDTDGSLAYVVYSGPSPFIWDTSEVRTDVQCYLSDPGASVASIIMLRPRLTSGGGASVITCSNCSAGYRSSPGDAACTECGLGFFSPPVAATCTICPPGQYCPSATTSTPVDCAPGSYRNTPGGKTQGDCTECPSGNYCPAKSVDPTNCSAGTYNPSTAQGDSGKCLPCNPGNYCPLATSTPTGCPAGTYNPSFSGASEAACQVCAIGKFSDAVGRQTDCPLCVANYYCKDSKSSAACPQHTTSAAGSSSLLHCQCVSGFRCAYTKKITAVVTLNTTLSNFQSDVGGVRTAFIAAVASAAGVTQSQVTINGVVQKTGGRRLLSVSPYLIDVRATVHGAERLRGLANHLARHSVHLHQSHTWEEDHSVHPTRDLRRKG